MNASMSLEIIDMPWFADSDNHSWVWRLLWLALVAGVVLATWYGGCRADREREEREEREKAFDASTRQGTTDAVRQFRPRVR
jgi:hypothetical protein